VPALAVAGVSGSPVAPRPAATVVVLRDGSAGLEVYIQRRTRTMGYAAGLWVFPGGRIDQADLDPAVDAAWAGPGPEVWARRLGLAVDQARGAGGAGWREWRGGGGLLLADREPETAALAAARQELLAGQESFAGVLDRLGVRLDASRLSYWAWWVTPEPEPRRYDTRFFVAALPAGAAATMHDLEAERERWLPVTRTTPDPLRMLPPTFCTLRELSTFGSVAEVLAAAEGRTVERILPVHADQAVVLPTGERIPVPVRPPAAAEARGGRA
jgi:8-oxo-dGTP pyrophosphatase MutT (NUDIX family)